MSVLDPKLGLRGRGRGVNGNPTWRVVEAVHIDPSLWVEARDPNPAPVRRVARWSRVLWMVQLGVAGVHEVYGVLHPQAEDTLSETTRFLWRTDTAWGRRLFWCFRALFAAWFGPHIVKVARQAGP